MTVTPAGVATGQRSSTTSTCGRTSRRSGRWSKAHRCHACDYRLRVRFSKRIADPLASQPITGSLRSIRLAARMLEARRSLSTTQGPSCRMNTAGGAQLLLAVAFVPRRQDASARVGRDRRQCMCRRRPAQNFISINLLTFSFWAISRPY